MKGREDKIQNSGVCSDLFPQAIKFQMTLERLSFSELRNDPTQWGTNEIIETLKRLVSSNVHLMNMNNAKIHTAEFAPCERQYLYQEWFEGGRSEGR